MDPMTITVVNVVGSFLLLAISLSLLSRISQWTHETQRKLDLTNELLGKLVEKAK